MKFSANEEAILAEFIGYYWLLFAMWCEENGHTAGDAESIRVKLENPLSSISKKEKQNGETTYQTGRD